MRIGIVVFSGTGHTLQVAERLQEALTEAGHEAYLERVTASGPPRPGVTDASLEMRPDIAAYDALVIGTAVWGGQPASPMLSYLNGLSSLEGKQVVCLATGFFAVAGWGRDQTLAKLKEMCEAKGATVTASSSVGWFCLRRKSIINEVVSELSGAFGAS